MLLQILIYSQELEQCYTFSLYVLQVHHKALQLLYIPKTVQQDVP